MERNFKLIQTIKENFRKGDDFPQGSQEGIDNIHVEQPSTNKNNPRGFDSNYESNHRWYLRGIRLPNIDMRKFDGKNPIIWIFQMEQFFDIHQVSNLQKTPIASLYLDPEQFVWYQ